MRVQCSHGCPYGSESIYTARMEIVAMVVGLLVAELLIGSCLGQILAGRW